MMNRETKRSLHATVLWVALTLVSISPARADVESAKQAIRKGECTGAVTELRSLAESENVEGEYWYGYLYKYGVCASKNEATGISWIRKAADNRLPIAQYTLGYLYEHGEGVPKDTAVAVTLFRKAADQGYADAQAALAEHYFSGDGVPNDDSQAVRLFRMAAEQGHVKAQVALGALYEMGRGTSTDYGQAVVWYRKAAEQGSAEAQDSLAVMYAKGRGVSQDNTQEVAWVRRAAEQGYAPAEYHLGYLYANGRGLQKDDSKALAWYRKAADHGSLDAEYAIGVAYEKSQGVPKDDEQAATWYRKAAVQGYVKAQKKLVTIYGGDGEKVPLDKAQAYFWLLIASAGGDQASRDYLADMERRISARERRNAQAAARNWKVGEPEPVVMDDAAKVEEFRDAMASIGVHLPPEKAKPEPPDQTRSSVRSEAADMTGTAFRVSGSQYLTNFHVVQGCLRLKLDGADVVGTPSYDAKNDLALLTMTVRSAPIAALRIGRARVGEAVVVAGFPLRGVLSGMNVTTGTISGLSGLGGDSRFLQITAPVQQGNSGGPLLDGSGNVMGVVESKLDAVKVAQITGDIPQNVNFAINSNTLQAFLEANGVDYKTGPLGSALPTTEIAARAKSFTVLVECWK